MVHKMPDSTNFGIGTIAQLINEHFRASEGPRLQHLHIYNLSTNFKIPGLNRIRPLKSRHYLPRTIAYGWSLRPILQHGDNFELFGMLLHSSRSEDNIWRLRRACSLHEFERAGPITPSVPYRSMNLPSTSLNQHGDSFRIINASSSYRRHKPALYFSSRPLQQR
ncbi:hypothetical protein BDD12DRAFT_237634 [Trichophaea hybrida]|nr:hypothetical protein BDD12DRAFT_237634 [Trichophaea hybrida]